MASINTATPATPPTTPPTTTGVDGVVPSADASNTAGAVLVGELPFPAPVPAIGIIPVGVKSCDELEE